jgi:hypothetical protein
VHDGAERLQTHRKKTEEQEKPEAQKGGSSSFWKSPRFSQKDGTSAGNQNAA